MEQTNSTNTQILYYLSRQKKQTLIMGVLAAVLLMFYPVSPAEPIVFLLILTAIYFYARQVKDGEGLNG